MATKIGRLIQIHKLKLGLAAILIAGAGYWRWTQTHAAVSEPRYVIATVLRSTVSATVTGSGQVAVLGQIDLKAKAAGDVIAVNTSNGQHVATGAVLVQLDTRAAQKAVRDGQTNLDAAMLALKKLTAPPDAVTLLQAKNALTQASDALVKLELTQATGRQQTLEARQKALDNILAAREEGFNFVVNAFADLPDIMAGMHTIIFGTSFGSSQTNLDYYAGAVLTYDPRATQYRNDSESAYVAARQAYDTNFADYKNVSRFAPAATLDAMIEQTYATTKLIAEAIKQESNLIQFYRDRLSERNRAPHPVSAEQLASLEEYASQTNAHLVSLLATQRSLQDNEESLLATQRELDAMEQNHPLERTAAVQAVAERRAALAKLEAGVDPLDVQSQELTVRQRQHALADAVEQLANYTIRAPFDGIVASVTVQRGDPLSGSTSVATLIAQQRLAEISLNEVDVAKIELGQPATLGFDAVPDLSLTGAVTEIETLGTVAQGVVSYAVKIFFDTQDPRIKPGMTVTANIITAIKQNVLAVPNAAVKTQGGAHYVEIAAVGGEVPADAAGRALPTPPERQLVEIGLANDEMTEIIAGVAEGQLVVTATISATTAGARIQAQPTGGLRIPGLPGGGGRGGFQTR